MGCTDSKENSSENKRRPSQEPHDDNDNPLAHQQRHHHHNNNNQNHQQQVTEDTLEITPVSSPLDATAAAKNEARHQLPKQGQHHLNDDDADENDFTFGVNKMKNVPPPPPRPSQIINGEIPKIPFSVLSQNRRNSNPLLHNQFPIASPHQRNIVNNINDDDDDPEKSKSVVPLRALIKLEDKNKPIDITIDETTTEGTATVQNGASPFKNENIMSPASAIVNYHQHLHQSSAESSMNPQQQPYNRHRRLSTEASLALAQAVLAVAVHEESLDLDSTHKSSNRGDESSPKMSRTQ